MARAGLGRDLLLANEVLDPDRLAAMATAASAAPDGDVRMTVAVDSAATVDAAAAAGIRDVLVDVNIGLPRCGCPPDEAGGLADLARTKGLTVRGVMGYEGHLMMVADRAKKREQVAAAVDLLLAAHADVGGDIVSSGGTGTFDLHDRVTEVQAGSYALMDTQYATLEFDDKGQPFVLALSVLGTVISVSPQWAVLDVGLKALGMDHGNPSVDGATVWFCSDEHLTYAPDGDERPERATGSGSGRPTSTRRWRCTSGCTSSRATRSSTPGPSTCAVGDRSRRGRGPAGLAARLDGRRGHGHRWPSPKPSGWDRAGRCRRSRA